MSFLLYTKFNSAVLQTWALIVKLAAPIGLLKCFESVHLFYACHIDKYL